MTGRTRPGGSAPGAPPPEFGPPARVRVRAPGEDVPPDRAAHVYAWSAALAVGVAILIMIVVSAAGPSAAVAPMPRPAAGPPWWFDLRLSPGLALEALWTAAILGGGGLVAGLAAVARGARRPARLLLTGALVAVAALTVLPPAGSTDTLSYAIDGRIAVSGHSPYVMTPGQLRRTGDPVARLAPPDWVNDLSIYGPLATAEEWAETLAPHWLNVVFQDNTAYLAPAIRLAAIVALVWLCLSASWGWRSGRRRERAG
ncbi:MAG: hypothetical protein ABSF03_07955 [Streptosporangiaceae bacterium]|jgi:hypothetical protein